MKHLTRSLTVTALIALIGATLPGLIPHAFGNSSDPLPELKTVSYVDTARYLGLWHEIARLPNSFQKNCGATTAEYSERRDGRINVVNSCETLKDAKPTGKIQQAKGVAWISDRTTNAKLKVSFLPQWLRWTGIGGKYWVIELGDDYEYSVVSEPGRKFAWILSREPKMSRETYERLLARMKEQGIATEKLVISSPGAIE